MNKIRFINPPWFGKAADGTLMKGVRAGSRWPAQYPARSKADAIPWVEGHYCPFPFFLAYAASYTAKNTGADVGIRDSIALHESYGAFYRYLAAEMPDLVFIESGTPCWDHDAKVITRMHEQFPTIRIAVCGPIAHPAAGKLAEILSLPGVVAAIAGEYEKGSARVANGQTGAIPYEALTKDEMNAAPFPMFDPATAWRYRDDCPLSPIMPHAQVWSSRGCLYRCNFCSWPATMTNDSPDGEGRRTVRHYTAEYMEAFLTEIVAKHRFKSIYFDDDTFNLGTRHVENMCGVMRKLRLPWSAMCRADGIPQETWKLMRDSGCYGVKIGFESGNQHIVNDVVGKHLDLKEARQTVIHLRSLGITVHGTFTFGHPGETMDQVKETIAYRDSMPLNTWQESGTALLGATPLDAADKRGEIGADFTRDLDGQHKVEQIRKELAAL